MTATPICAGNIATVLCPVVERATLSGLDVESRLPPVGRGCSEVCALPRLTRGRNWPFAETDAFTIGGM